MHFFSSRNSSSRIFSYGNTEYATKVAHLFAQTFPSVFRRGIFTSADFFRLINFSSIVHTYIFVSACFRTYIISYRHLSRGSNTSFRITFRGVATKFCLGQERIQCGVAPLSSVQTCSVCRCPTCQPICLRSICTCLHDCVGRSGFCTDGTRAAVLMSSSS